MKLLVVGSTGGTGRELLQRGIAAGHTMVALARRPAALEARAGLTVVQGDVDDRESLGAALQGVDAVISALGPGGLKASKSAGDLLSRGTGALVEAMLERKVSRLVVVSSVGVEDDPTEGFVYRRVLKPFFLKDLYADMRIMERAVVQSGLDWTLVRPPRLIDGPPRGAFKVRIGGNVPFGRTMTRADLAEYLIAAAVGRDNVHAVVGVSHEGRN